MNYCGTNPKDMRTKAHPLQKAIIVLNDVVGIQGGENTSLPYTFLLFLHKSPCSKYISKVVLKLCNGAMCFTFLDMP